MYSEETAGLDKFIASQYGKLLRSSVDNLDNKAKFFFDKFCMYAGIDHIPFNIDETQIHKKSQKNKRH